MTILECQVRIYTFVYPSCVGTICANNVSNMGVLSETWTDYPSPAPGFIPVYFCKSVLLYCVVLCLFSFCGWCPMSHVSLHCPFLIVRSIYSNVLFRHITAVSFISGGNQRTLDRQRTISFHNISNTYRKIQ